MHSNYLDSCYSNNPTGISESSSGSVSVAAVAGGAVGGIVVILAVVFIVLFVIRPNKKRYISS